jgi:YVTN family beta-propeller protein
MGISVINTTTNGVTNLSVYPSYSVAVTPDGKNVYATNNVDGTVSVINTTTNIVTAIVNLGSNTGPYGVAVTPDGTKVYVADNGRFGITSNTVYVINTTTNKVIDTVPVGLTPAAFGQFIGPYPSTPTITWSNLSNIVYGTALSSTQLDATASVPGTFIYTPPAGTVLSAGQQILTATFTPIDTVNYTTASATALINVTQATPTIT